jgi:hypothetical protein
MTWIDSRLVRLRTGTNFAMPGSSRGEVPMLAEVRLDEKEVNWTGRLGTGGWSGRLGPGFRFKIGGRRKLPCEVLWLRIFAAEM